MTALEIVLTALLGVLVCVIVLLLTVNGIINKYTAKRVNDYEILNKSAPENPIVFLGDSLTELFPVHEFIPDGRIVNRGISNETTKDVLNRIDGITLLNPRAVILQVGINDFLRGKIRTPEVVAKNVITVIEALNKKVGDIKVVSLYPVNKKRLKVSFIYLRRVNNKTICRTNEILRNYCKESGIDFINVYPLLLGSDMNLNKAYTLEGLHLNIAGYDKITPLFKETVQNIK